MPAASITNEATKKNLQIFVCIALGSEVVNVWVHQNLGWETLIPKFTPIPTPQITAILTLLRDGVFSSRVDHHLSQ